uniref:Kinesin motor domain-containing protein n=1 Tax=Glossina brevipalpis TaxID=37001 RepID=A0A1A9WBM0_9MUSC
MANEEKNIKVTVIVRPFNGTELELEENAKRNFFQVIDSTKLLFDPDEEDEELFFHGVKQKYREFSKRSKNEISMEYGYATTLVDSILNSYNCCMFVCIWSNGCWKNIYNAWQSYLPGLNVFNNEQPSRKKLSNQLIMDIVMICVYLEVYNEKVINLLTNDGSLKLREDANGVFVSDTST